MKRLCQATVLSIVLVPLGCTTETRNTEALELQRQQLAAIQEAQRLEVARLEAMRLEAERIRREEQERARREALVRDYSRQAGRQVMSAIGGGQDLIVQHGQWSFDARRAELEIPIDVSFNGSIIRSNNYRVSGVLTVREDGSSPRFARANANENYRNMEDTLTALAITAAGIMILSDMSQAER